MEGLHLGEGWAAWIPVMVCGEDVKRKKPDPEVYGQVLRALGITPLQAVALEDSPGGVAAARAADVPVIVTLSSYFSAASFEGAIAIGPGLHDRSGWRPLPAQAPNQRRAVNLADIEQWHAQMDMVSHHA